MEEKDPSLTELQEQLSSWRALVKTAGWSTLERYAKAQKDHRLGPLIRGRSEQIIDLVNREYDRGEIAGIEFFMNIPSIEIARLEEEIDKLAKLEENDDAD